MVGVLNHEYRTQIELPKPTGKPLRVSTVFAQPKIGRTASRQLMVT